MSRQRYLFLVLVSLWSLPASADCVYNGKRYAEGTIIGDFVCSNGRWEQR